MATSRKWAARLVPSVGAAGVPRKGLGRSGLAVRTGEAWRELAGFVGGRFDFRVPRSAVQPHRYFNELPHLRKQRWFAWGIAPAFYGVACKRSGLERFPRTAQAGNGTRGAWRTAARGAVIRDPVDAEVGSAV